MGIEVHLNDIFIRTDVDWSDVFQSRPFSDFVFYLFTLLPFCVSPHFAFIVNPSFRYFSYNFTTSWSVPKLRMAA